MSKIIVINALLKKTTPNWVLYSKLEEILNYMDKLKEVCLTHIFREGNSKVDKLANKGADSFNILKINNISYSNLTPIL